MKRYVTIILVSVCMTFLFKAIPKFNHWMLSDPNTTFNRLRALDQRVTALEARCRN